MSIKKCKLEPNWKWSLPIDRLLNGNEVPESEERNFQNFGPSFFGNTDTEFSQMEKELFNMINSIQNIEQSSKLFKTESSHVLVICDFLACKTKLQKYGPIIWPHCLAAKNYI